MKIDAKSAFRYEHVLQVLEKKIDTGEYKTGDRLPTENELAEIFGVHRLTVRKAVTALQRRGKVCRHQGKGTYVGGSGGSCGAGKDGKPLSILYVGDIEGRIFGDQFLSFARAASTRGYRFFGVHPSDFSSQGIEELEKGLLSGVNWLILDTHTGAGAMDTLKKTTVPVICVGYSPLPLAKPSYNILKGQAGAIEMAVGHLAAKGHRRIVLVTNKTQLPEASSGKGRNSPRASGAIYAAYRGALVHHGLDNAPPPLVFAGENLAKNTEVACAYLERHLPAGPLAFVCQADFRAREVYAAAERLGLKIPADLSVIGLGDTTWARALLPRLTSLNYGEEQMACLTMQLCAGPPPAQRLVCTMEPRVVERDSVARL